jgi:hypothetical protein
MIAENGRLDDKIQTIVELVGGLGSTVVKLVLGTLFSLVSVQWHKGE